jgi:hypothetical protein
MHAYLRRALCAVGLTGGIVLLGIGLAEAASADGPSGPVTTGESGILSGNQTGVDAQAPINASGNQVTVIGQDNKTTSTGGAATTSPPSGSPTTSGQNGIGSGNQTGVAAQVPVNASGNQVTVIGQRNQVHSTAGSASGAPAGTSTSPPAPTTSGRAGILSGNQTAIGLQVPVNVSGNQVTVIGQDNTVSSLGGSATGVPAGTSSGSPTSGPVTSGQDGILSGNQTGVVALVPVNVSGNQVTVIGQDNTVSSLGGSATGMPAGTSSGSPTSGPVTSGQNGILSGNQTGVGVLAPIGATGNQITVIGQDNTLTSTGTTTTGGSTTGPGQTTTGEGGVGSGNQTPVVVNAPVDSSGNQVTVIGQDNTDTSTSSTTTGGTSGSGGGTTSPPGGTVVSPPTAGGSGGSTGAQAVSGPADSALPNTGAPAGLLGAGLLGLLLTLLGGAILRREEADL